MNKENIKFTLRLNLEEYSKLIYQDKEMNTTQIKYIRELIRKGLLDDIKEYNIFLNKLRKFTRNLSNNINQISKKINNNSILNEIEEVKNINEEVKKIWQLLVNRSGKQKKL